jgi:DNA (cytosine-5)-methyltransferase 1
MIYHGSLFSGIGGFDLAAQWCGWTNVFQCENNDFCQKILKHHFLNTELHADIKTTDFTKYRDTIDIISGGFPCQPFSVAGKRRGTEDDRFLWEEMFRTIREITPSWVVAENVYGLLTQQNGLVFKRVCADLESEGYEVQPFVIPACAVNAPHRRDRVWIVANAKFN